MKLWLAARPLLLIVMIATFALALPGTTEATSLNEIKKLTASDAQIFDEFGYSVAFSGDTIVAGAWMEDAGGDINASYGAAYVFVRDQGGAGNWGEVKKLSASDAQAGDLFGRRVAVSGDTAVVGADGEDTGGSFAGAAYLYHRNEGGADNWGEVTKLTASDADAFDHFGFSVAISGDTAIVGAHSKDAAGSPAGSGEGAAYIFQRDVGGAGNWGELKKLTASDAQIDDRFGWSVAISGGIIVVGASGEDDAGMGAGAVYVFQRNQSGTDNWGEVKKLTASDAQAGDFFGSSVAVSGDTAVVGAPVSIFAEPASIGTAYVFQRDQGATDNWGEVNVLTASDAQIDDQFGFSVAVSGDIVVVGAYHEDAEGSDAGAAYVFQRNQGGVDSWGEVNKLLASNALASDNFGRSVGASGDTVVVGAPAPNVGPASSGTGTAYVFQPSPPPPVGGIARDSDLRALPLETTNPDGSPGGILSAIVVAAALVAVSGAAWYTRRRVTR